MNSTLGNALIELYPQVTSIVGDIAYDADGKEVAYDINAINAKVAEDEQAQATAKASALAKLAALGLTTADLTALGL